MHLHINQAGRFIKCLLVTLPKGMGLSRSMGLSGTLDGARFAMTTEDGQPGTLAVAGKDLSLTIAALGLAEEPFQQISDRATFFEEAFTPFADAGTDLGATRKQLDELRNREMSPLTKAQLRTIDQEFALEKIKPFLDRYDADGSRTDGPAQHRRLNAINGGNRLLGEPGLEDHVGEVLDPSKWPREQIELARERARWVLSGGRIVHGSSMQSSLDLIQSAVAEVLAISPRLRLPNLRALLGWPAEGASPQLYTYEMTLKLKYIEKKIVSWSYRGFRATVNGGLYYGKLGVTADEGWTQDFNIVLLGPRIVAGKGKPTLSASGSVTAPSRWGTMEFNGWAKLIDGGAWAGAKVPIIGETVGRAPRQGTLIVHGTENHPRLRVPLTFEESPVEGIGGDLSFLFGRIECSDTAVHDESTLPRQVEYQLQTKEQRSTHFLLGSAVVHGRDGIRRFCANWLPWLMSPVSSLEIIGYADNVGYSDRQDEPERNQELSEMRAQNVHTALKDILGERLAIKDAKVKGMGDTYAREHDPPRTEYRLRRRADVVLNGKCVFSIPVA
jgi:hypothetical protein